MTPFKSRFRREKVRELAVYLATAALSAVFIVVGSRIASSGRPFFPMNNQLAVQAEIIAVTGAEIEEFELGGEKMVRTFTFFDAALIGGEYAGSIVKALQIDDPLSPYRLREAGSGDKVFLLYAPEQEEKGARWVLQDYRRTDYLIVMGIFVAVLMLVFGRKKGVSTLIALMYTCLAVFAVFIPSVISGKNIYISSMIVGVFIISVTIIMVNGLGRKSFCAGVGCIFGFGASGVMTIVMDHFLKLTGLVDEDSVLLLYLNPENPVNLKAIIFASITIGALGAVMDVAVSMASALNEVYEADPSLTLRGIMRSGMNIGRDVIGTMSNTLILAYIGGSMPLVVLLTAYNDSLIIMLNKEMVVVEILQALVGVAGLLMVIPLTSMVCGWVFTHERPLRKNDVKEVD